MSTASALPTPASRSRSAIFFRLAPLLDFTMYSVRPSWRFDCSTLSGPLADTSAMKLLRCPYMRPQYIIWVALTLSSIVEAIFSSGSRRSMNCVRKPRMFALIVSSTGVGREISAASSACSAGSSPLAYCTFWLKLTVPGFRLRSVSALRAAP